MNGDKVVSPSEDNVLALSPREAAKSLGISPRTLWTYTQRGEVPHVRLGRRVLYPVAELQRWFRGMIQTPAR